MGIYVDPPNMSKEEWLRNHGEKVFDVDWLECVNNAKRPVVLIFNPSFTAAGLAFSEKELHRLLSVHIREIYLVPITVLRGIFPDSVLELDK